MSLRSWKVFQKCCVCHLSCRSENLSPVPPLHQVHAAVMQPWCWSPTFTFTEDDLQGAGWKVSQPVQLSWAILHFLLHMKISDGHRTLRRVSAVAEANPSSFTLYHLRLVYVCILIFLHLPWYVYKQIWKSSFFKISLYFYIQCVRTDKMSVHDKV